MKFDHEKYQSVIIHSEQALAAEGYDPLDMYAWLFGLFRLGRVDDELHLAPDGEVDIGWWISREGKEGPVMAGLLHFDFRDGMWSSHT